MAGVAGVLAGLGLTAAGGGRELLQRQAAVARRRIGKPLGEDAIDADKLWKKAYGDPLRLLLLGDSIAAGLGAERRKDTLGGRLARGLAKELHRSVDLRTAAVVGCGVVGARAQIDGLPASYRPDVAVIVVGGNDVTHRVPIGESVEHLEEAVGRLRSQGAVVVVGTCPTWGRFGTCRSRCARSAPGCRGSSRLPRRTRRSARVRTRSRSPRWSARSSSPTRTRCSASTASTRARWATSARPRRCCRRS